MIVDSFDPAGGSGSKKIVYFSRGRGRGHAILDIEIAAELDALRSDLQILFVSYGTGARTFQDRGIPVVDLGLPDANSIAATTVIAGRVLGHLRPDLVVAHEEFAAMTAAKIFGLKTVMITDFFEPPGKFSTESLWFADHVLFLDHPAGAFQEPPSVAGKLQYLGPQMRKFEYGTCDRDRARTELGIDVRATVIGVFPGSWTEAMAPFADPLVRAFAQVPSPKHLLWLAGDDAAELSSRSLADTTVLSRDWRIDRLMAACDLAVTKSNRMTVRELAQLGIRTLSVSWGLNPADDNCIAPLAANRSVDIASFGDQSLLERLADPEPEPVLAQSTSCAHVLAGMI